MFQSQRIKTRARVHKRLPALEELDGRTLLSTGMMPNWQGSLFIQGTSVQFSPMGLPSSMSGTIYPTAQMSGNPIGNYQETLQPIFMGGQFVGTTGTATFSFYATNWWSQWPIGSFTSSDTSYITGMEPTGALDVHSTATIVSSTGLLSGMTGTFSSASQVALGPSFSLNTEVDYSAVGPWLADATMNWIAPPTQTSNNLTTSTSTTTSSTC